MRKLRVDISSIKDKLRSIRESRQTYRLEFGSAGDRRIELNPGGDRRISSLRSLRRSYPEDEDQDVVGMEAYARVLKAKLMKENDRRCVVSVVGMGGLGKTTLAKRVYGDIDVKRHFDCCAWAFVSQQYTPREILMEILMQVGFRDPEEERSTGRKKFTREVAEDTRNKRETLKSLIDHELVLLLKDELCEKRYLIVLDDIWSLDAWYGLQSAFPKGVKGSKVVFTTRNKEVAVSVDPHNSPIEPPLLTTEESWELLQRKVFPIESFTMFESPLDFEQLGKEMVERCSGLPLAVVVLSGLLRTKPSLDEWRQVLRNVKAHVGKLRSEHQYAAENILELSFQDLPYYLRPCFLYLGIFPEDSEIPKRMLIRLWIAEGFISDIAGSEEVLIEDVAERCLEDLVDRCMVKVTQLNHTRKSIKTCQLHDLMRDFCISKSKEENFFETAGNTPFFAKSRRIAIHNIVGSTIPWTKQPNPRLRSLLVSGMDPLSFSPPIKKNLALLRVLELNFVDAECGGFKLPVRIGDLIYLKYLRYWNLSRQTLKIPHSIGNLRNLMTLDLKKTYSVLLPSTMSRLINLRHLLIPYFSSHARWMLRSINLFGNMPLTNIVTLKYISASDLIRSKASLTLTNIRVLGIMFKSHQEYNTLISSLWSQLVHVKSCTMTLENGEFPNLKLLSQCGALSGLCIYGEMSRQVFSGFPRTLSKLKLGWFELNKDKLAIMEKLLTLRILSLHFNYTSRDKKMVFSSDGFPKLETLTLTSLRGVEEWEVEKGAMPKLEMLNIQYLIELATLPEGLKYISSLRELNIKGMKKAFEDRVRVNEDGVEGADFHKVRHVPLISISDTWDYN